MQVSLTRPDQFSIKSNCKEYAYGIIKPITDKIINKLLNNTDEPKKVETKKVEPKKVETKKVEPKKVETKVEPKKLKKKLNQ